MNPRKMLALLGPRSPSLTRLMHREYGLGSGNRSPVTPMDVAGALAWVGDRTAVDLYMLLWFPGWSERSGNEPRITDSVAGILLTEWTTRTSLRRPPRLQAFPSLPNPWQADPRAGCGRVARAALFEIRHRHDCPDCSGFGMVPAIKDGVMVAAKCGHCEGRGYLPYGKKLRAQLVKLRKQVYVHHVDAPYSWLLGTLRELEQKAAHAHYVALRDEAPVSLSSSTNPRSSASR